MSATTQMQKGTLGEDAAARLLTENGYSILFRNYRCRYGELDIVAENGDTLAIVEVKTRRRNSLVSPTEAVGYNKILKIIRTTEALLEKNPDFNEKKLSFDIISVILNKDNIIQIEHYKNSFSSIDYL